MNLPDRVAKLERGLYIGPFRVPGFSEKPRYVSINDNGEKVTISKEAFELLKGLGAKDRSSQYTVTY